MVIEKNGHHARLLFDELQKLTRKESLFSDLFDAPPYPHFAALCRWEKEGANCISLDTAIVDKEGNIRICWNGDVIGRIGVPFPEIREKLNHLKGQVEKQRGCNDCPKVQVCSRCMFPHPLEEQEFCTLKKNSHCEETADLIRHLDIFK